MKHAFVVLIAFLGSHLAAGQPKLFGTTAFGGSHNAGVLYSVKPDGTEFTKLHDFDDTDGKHPHGPLTSLPAGKLAGVTAHGGANGKGILYTINTDGTGFTVLKHMTARPSIGLLLASNGKLYGATASTQALGGAVFSINSDGTDYTELQHFNPLPFDSEDFATPLIELPDGRLLGTTNFGDTGWGQVYQIAKEGSSYSVLHHFDFWEGGNPRGVMLASNGRLYITCSSGGDTDAYSGGYGSIVSMKTDGTDVQELFGWTNAPGAMGKYPHWGLTEGPDGKLYGTTAWHGETNDAGGVVFKINLDGSGYTPLYFAEKASGEQGIQGITFYPGGRIYTTFMTGGSAGPGTIVGMNPDGTDVVVLKNFDYDNGAIPGNGTFLLAEVPKHYHLTGTITKPGAVKLSVGLAKLFYAKGGLVRKADVKDGLFKMDSIAPGQYILQVIPLGDDHDVFSTYYQSTHFHAEAEVISVDGDVTLTMEMLGKKNSSDDNTRKGEVKGRVIAEGKSGGRFISGRIATGTGVPNVPVYLLDGTANTVTNAVVTDATGYFELMAIASGSYRLALDVVGTPLSSTSQAITIGQNTSMLITASVSGSNNADVSFSVDVITGVEPGASVLSVYPNPAVDRFIIQGSPRNWLMYAADGRTVDAPAEILSSGNTEVRVGHLPPGLYLLRVSTDAGTRIVKVIKSN